MSSDFFQTKFVVSGEKWGIFEVRVFSLVTSTNFANF
jgi:hypothetical protein